MVKKAVEKEWKGSASVMLHQWCPLNTYI